MALFDSKNALNHAIRYLADVAQKRAAGGEVSDRARSYHERKQKLLQEQFPTHYMPEVGRQVMMAGGVPDDIPPPPMGHNNPPDSMSFEGLHPQLISQRMPTNVRAEEDPNQQMLLANVDAMKRNPRVFTHNINLIKGYGHLKDEEMQGGDDQTAENFINHMKDNLLFLHDSMHPELRERAKLWYVGANKFANKIADRHGVPLAASAAAIAAMSPQKDWFQNASLAERLMDIHHNQADTPYTRDMEMTANRIFGDEKYDSLLNAIRGKSYSQIEDPTEKAVWLRLFDQTYHDPSYRQLSPEGDLGDFNQNDDGSRSKMAWGSLNEISKGISALLGGANRNLISELMGERHKIRNFYNNILAPNSPSDDVTVDTHAVAAALLRPLASNGIPVAHNFKNSPEAGFEAAKGDNDTGVQGTYPLYVEALRRAAAERGTLPREMQSITWEGVRGLFPDTFKNESNLAAVDGIWSKYRAGEIDVNEARKQIFDLAGGINAPAWSVGQGLGPDEKAPDTSYERKLSPSGIYGQSTGMEPRVGAAASSPFTGLEEKDIQGFERHRQLARASQQAYGSQNGLPQSFQKRNGRGREQDLGVPVAAVHTPTEDAIAQFSAAEISAPEMLELKPGAKAAMRFHQAIMDAKNSHTAGASVHAYDPKEYRDMRLFLTPDGSAGFGLKGDDIVSVFNNRNSGLKNVSNSMLQLAIQQGGRKLDAFDTELPHIYSRNKFRVVARMPWNEEYKPEGWNHADYAKYNNGRPDVVFMALDTKREDLYDGREGTKVSDYDAAVDLQTKGVKRANKNLARLIKKAYGGFIGYREGGSVYEPHQRAEEQGYTIKGYHFTRGARAENIARSGQFDPTRSFNPDEEAVFFWTHPEAANEWMDVHGPYTGQHEDRLNRYAPTVMPVRINPGKHLEVNWPEINDGSANYYSGTMGNLIKKAKQSGYDSIKIKNMKEADMSEPHDQLAILNPTLIRSEFAKFDPEKQGINNIGAARGGEIRDHLAIGGNPGDIAGGGFGTGNIGGGSSISSGGSMADARAADRASVSGYSADFGGGGGGGGRDYGGIDFGGSSRDNGPGLGFGGAELMSPLRGISNGVPMFAPARSQEQMLRALGVEGDVDSSGLPTALRPGGNIGAALTKEALTPDLTTANSPLASGIPAYNREALDTINDRMRSGQAALRDASVARVAGSPPPAEANIPNAGDLYGATNAPLAVNQQPSGMLGQPPMGTTTFGTGIRQSGFPAQQVAPSANQSLEDYMGTTPPSDMQQMLTKQQQKTNQFNVNVKDFLDATGSPLSYATTYGMALPRLEAKNIAFQPGSKVDPATGLPATGIATFQGDINAKLTPEQQAAKDEFDRQFGKSFTPIMKTTYGVEERGPMVGGDLTGPQMNFGSFVPASTQAQDQTQPSGSDVMRGTMGITPPSSGATPRIGMAGLAQQPIQTSDAQQQMTVKQNFEKAFADARARGKQTFTWTNPLTGKSMLYTTQLARKAGGRVPSLKEPDQWVAEPEKPRSVAKTTKPRKPSKVSGTAIVERALMLSSRKS